MTGNAKLHDKIVHQLLGALLGQSSVGNISFHVDVKEAADTSQGHCRAVLLLDGTQICEIGPLNSFSCVCGRLTDVKAVHCRHFLQIPKEGDLLEQLLVKTDLIGIKCPVSKLCLVLLLFLNETVYAVEGYAAVVTDDASASVGVGKTRDDVAFSRQTHLVGVGAEYAVVVGGAEAEFLLHLTAQFIAVCLASLTRHAHAAKGVDAALQGAIGLHTHDDLVVLINISGGIAGKGGYRGGINVQYAAKLTLQGKERLQLLHQSLGSGSGACQEVSTSLVFLVVGLNKIAHVDLVLPCAASKSAPMFVFHLFSPPCSPICRQKKG